MSHAPTGVVWHWSGNPLRAPRTACVRSPPIELDSDMLYGTFVILPAPRPGAR